MAANYYDELLGRAKKGITETAKAGIGGFSAIDTIGRMVMQPNNLAATYQSMRQGGSAPPRQAAPPAGIPQQPLVDNDAAAAAAGSGIPTAPMAESPLAPPMRRFGNTDAYVDATPAAGFGRVSYSDTQQGLNAPMRGNNLPGGGQGYAVAQGFGPFGRTPEEQQKIADRVAQYKSAIDLMREIRGWGQPSERDRLTGRAQQQIGLNQGLGGFLNQAADRNYAREQLTALDSREKAAAENQTEAARLKFDMEQKGIENALKAQEVGQGRFKLQTYTKDYDPLGRAIQGISLLDTREGAVTDPTAGLQPAMTLDQARMQAMQEMNERAGLFSSDQSDFGMDRNKWVEQRVQELMGNQGQEQQQAPTVAVNPRTGERMQWNPQTEKWEPIK